MKMPDTPYDGKVTVARTRKEPLILEVVVEPPRRSWQYWLSRSDIWNIPYFEGGNN
jgi:hypothetical protein